VEKLNKTTAERSEDGFSCMADGDIGRRYENEMEEGRYTIKDRRSI